ncbi:hypothetical protein HK097_010542 [Rhizophlyctis rosea]|uniref:Uncharacterized protein n=1 Tax=Rhizophlyctis rosea TaxID=64517 RepID=A0AAD5S7C4_9FUNG|nr:hypothetical protein HK097_010542 [Rhizophlyctis rosea]
MNGDKLFRKDPQLAKYGYYSSILELFIAAGVPMIWLLSQYRMAHYISEFANQQYYGGRLRNAGTTMQICPPKGAYHEPRMGDDDRVWGPVLAHCENKGSIINLEDLEKELDAIYEEQLRVAAVAAAAAASLTSSSVSVDNTQNDNQPLDNTQRPHTPSPPPSDNTQNDNSPLHNTQRQNNTQPLNNTAKPAPNPESLQFTPHVGYQDAAVPAESSGQGPAVSHYLPQKANVESTASFEGQEQTEGDSGTISNVTSVVGRLSGTGDDQIVIIGAIRDEWEIPVAKVLGEEDREDVKSPQSSRRSETPWTFSARHLPLTPTQSPPHDNTQRPHHFQRPHNTQRQDGTPNPRTPFRPALTPTVPSTPPTTPRADRKLMKGLPQSWNEGDKRLLCDSFSFHEIPPDRTVN